MSHLLEGGELPMQGLALNETWRRTKRRKEPRKQNRRKKKEKTTAKGKKLG